MSIGICSSHNVDPRQYPANSLTRGQVIVHVAEFAQRADIRIPRDINVFGGKCPGCWRGKNRHAFQISSQWPTSYSPAEIPRDELAGLRSRIAKPRKPDDLVHRRSHCILARSAACDAGRTASLFGSRDRDGTDLTRCIRPGSASDRRLDRFDHAIAGN